LIIRQGRTTNQWGVIVIFTRNISDEQQFLLFTIKQALIVRPTYTQIRSLVTTSKNLW